MDLPKLLMLTCSCLACPLVGVGPYGWLVDGVPCAVSLIVVGSFTLFTVGCGCIVNWVLCLSLIVVGSFTLFTVGCGCIVNWVLCLHKHNTQLTI